MYRVSQNKRLRSQRCFLSLPPSITVVSEKDNLFKNNIKLQLRLNMRIICIIIKMHGSNYPSMKKRNDIWNSNSFNIVLSFFIDEREELCMLYIVSHLYPREKTWQFYIVANFSFEIRKKKRSIRKKMFETTIKCFRKYNHLCPELFSVKFRQIFW